MHDINLLPWRQALHARVQQKRWFFRTIFLVTGIVSLMLLHWGWMIENSRLDAELLLLTKQWDLYKHPVIAQETELLSGIHTKQKIFWRWFSLFACLSRHRIRLVKMDYQESQIFLVGRMASMLDLSGALAICHFPANPKITITPLQQSDFLQFYIYFLA